MTKKKRQISDSEYLVIPRWAITQLGLRGTELNVFGLIYSYNDNGKKFTGNLSYISEWLGIDKARASEHLNSLLNKGLITRKGEFQGGKTHYEYYTKNKPECCGNRNIAENANIAETATECCGNRNNNVAENANSTIINTQYNTLNNTLFNTQRACAREAKNYRENVFLSSEEYRDLISRYGEDGTETMLDILSAHKLKTGAEYASDYGAILDWVIERYERRRQNEARRKNTPGREERAAAEEEENLRAAMRLREINRSRAEATGA